MNEGPMTATEIKIKMELFWKEKQPEFDRVFKKHFGAALDRLRVLINTRAVLGPPPTFMQDSWDLICLVMVILTLTFLVWLNLHANGVL